MPYWRLFYHFVWATRLREPLIAVSFEPDLHNVIVGKAQELGAIVHAAGGTADHMHLVASVPPRIALSEFVGQVKGNSSHFVNHVLQLPYPFQWQHEYGVVSFGGKQLDLVVRYARSQREHHAAATTLPFLERAQMDDGEGAPSTADAGR